MSPNTDLSYAALNASTDEADLTFAGRAFHGFTTRLLKKLDLKANDEVSFTRDWLAERLVTRVQRSEEHLSMLESSQ